MSVNVANCDLEGLVDSGGNDQRTHKKDNATNTEEYEIRLFDFSGRIIFSNKITRSILDIRSHIRTLMPELPTGIYVIHVLSSEGTSVRKIFID